MEPGQGKDIKQKRTWPRRRAEAGRIHRPSRASDRKRPEEMVIRGKYAREKSVHSISEKTKKKFLAPWMSAWFNYLDG